MREFAINEISFKKIFNPLTIFVGPLITLVAV